MRCGTKLCHCELMNGSKPRAGAAPLSLPQVNSATIPLPPGQLCVYSSPSSFSPARASASASPPTRSAPSSCLTSSRRLVLSGHHPSRTAPKTQPSNAQSRSTSTPRPTDQNRKSKLRWGSCSRSLYPPDPWSPSRTPHCPTRPPCLPRSRSPKTTSPAPNTVSPRYDWIWGDGFRLCRFAVVKREVRRERELGQIRRGKTRHPRVLTLFAPVGV